MTLLSSISKSMIELISYQSFINTMGDKVADNDSSRTAMMMSPSGFGISLIQHIGKEGWVHTILGSWS